MKKIKIFSIAIMVALLCVCTMQIAFAEAVTPEGYYYDEASGITFKLDDTNKEATTYIFGTYVKDSETGAETYTYNATATSVTVPAAITVGEETYNVTKIGEYTFAVAKNKRGFSAAKNNTTIKTFTLPEGITEIEPYAFYSCRGGVKSITIPSTVTTLGENAFTNSHQIEEIIFTGNLITEIPASCFAKCESLISLDFPASVEKIYMSAFQNNFDLATVKIRGEDVELVAASTTLGLPVAMGLNPNDITNGKGLVFTKFYVKNDTMKTKLMDLAKMGNPTSSGKEYDLTGIADGSQIKLFFDPITIDNITYSQYDDNGTEAIITGNTFEAKTNADVEIPSTITVNDREVTVKAVGPQAFCYLDEDGKPATGGQTIKSIVLPETVTSIGKQAFMRHNYLKTFVAKGDIVLNEEDIEIFRGCSSLTELDFKSVNRITDGMFFDCDDLPIIVIPTGESIAIAKTAFDRCDLLTDVYLNAGTVTFAGNDSTDADNMKTLTMKFHVPTESAKTALTEYGVPEANVVTGKKLYLLDNLLGTYAVASEAMDEGKVIVATYEKDALVDVDEIKDVDFEVGYNEIETDLEKSKTVERRIFVWNSLNNIFPLGSMIK